MGVGSANDDGANDDGANDDGANDDAARDGPANDDAARDDAASDDAASDDAASAGCGSERPMVSVRTSWSTSIPPGPMLPHSGTCDAPKCPPIDHRAGLRGRAVCRYGAGAPAGQRRGTCHESSQPRISPSPIIW